MSCTNTALAANTFMAQVIEASFQLRNLGPQLPEQVYTQFQLIYPESPYSEVDIQNALIAGGKTGVFSVCEQSPYSGIYLYKFDRNMVSRNPSNAKYGIPIIVNSASERTNTCAMPFGVVKNTGGSVYGTNSGCCTTSPTLPI